MSHKANMNFSTKVQKSENIFENTYQYVTRLRRNTYDYVVLGMWKGGGSGDYKRLFTR